MAVGKRIFLFLAVNILVIATLSITLSLLGVKPYLTARGIDYEALLVFCLIWGMGGAFISLSLSRIIAKWMMGVKVIDPRANQGGEAQLLQLVYSLAKRAGLTTMPEVGIYDSPEVNAFATGPTKSRSLVAVSSGLLHRMNQEQIEGVLGHEIAHIANGDMVTMTLIQGVLNAFVMFISRVVAFAVSQSVKEEARRAVHFGVVLVMDILLSLLASFVVAYYSRRREFRADAGGGRIAGRERMISALKALKTTTQLVDTGHASLATLKISSKPSGLLALLSSHPPLDERIQRLERGIDQ